MDRRRFCVASAAAAFCVGAEHEISAAQRPPATPIALDRVLFDSRHPESCAFGSAAARAGWCALGFSGDVTPIWRQTLLPLWAVGGGAIAGMTTPEALFCLDQQAKDHWMRVVLRIEHRPVPSGVPVHRVTAAEPMLTRACAALDDAPDWPARSFSLLRTCVRSRNQPRISRIASCPDRGRDSFADLELVSWIIAA
jgi:hypothetical protein